VKEVFTLLDIDGSGTVDRDELQLLMIFFGDRDIPLTNTRLDKAMRAMDADGDGSVEFEEFWQWFDGRRSRPRSRPQDTDMDKAPTLSGKRQMKRSIVAIGATRYLRQTERASLRLSSCVELVWIASPCAHPGLGQ
jgi:hypothetical protein